MRAKEALSYISVGVWPKLMASFFSFQALSPALMTWVFVLQTIVAAAKPEDALDVGLSASGFRKADHDVLDSYIMARETQQSGPSSASDGEDGASGSESSSEKDSGPGVTAWHARHAAVCSSNSGHASGSGQAALGACAGSVMDAG